MKSACEDSDRLTLQGLAVAGFPVLYNARSKGRRSKLGRFRIAEYARTVAAGARGDGRGGWREHAALRWTACVNGQSNQPLDLTVTPLAFASVAPAGQRHCWADK